MQYLVRRVIIKENIMNQKKIIYFLLIVLILLIGLGIAGYFYLTNTKVSPNGEVSLTEGGLVENNTLPEEDTTSVPTADLAPGEVPRLRKISATPISGAEIFTLKTGTSSQDSVIKYIDRATGNAYQTTRNSLETKRITTTTLPKTYFAYFMDGGISVVLQSLTESSAVSTYVASLNEASSEIFGKYIRENAFPLVVSPFKNRFFYLTKESTGAVGYISDSKTKETQVFSHPLSDWSVQWVNENTLMFTTKPASAIQSVSYLYDLRVKKLSKVFGPKNGLTALSSPLLDKIIYSETIQEKLLTGIHDTKTNSDTYLEQTTLADKCVWSSTSVIVYCGVPKTIPSGKLPDIWYQGLLSTNDRIVAINTNTQEETIIVDPQNEAGEEIDTQDLKLSADGNYLIFTNKKDLSLWGLKLN